MAILSANETTGVLFDNYNVIDFLVGGWRHGNQYPYRLDGKLDLRELLSPLTNPSHEGGAGRFTDAGGAITATWDHETTGSFDFMSKAVMHNVTTNWPRFLAANVGIAIGGKVFQDVAAPKLNAMLKMVPINQRSKKKGLLKYIKF